MDDMKTIKKERKYFMIPVDKSTAKKIKELKIYKKESYDEILIRVLFGKKEGGDL